MYFRDFFASGIDVASQLSWPGHDHGHPERWRSLAYTSDCHDGWIYLCVYNLYIHYIHISCIYIIYIYVFYDVSINDFC